MKILRIITSRFKKDRQNQWVKERRQICSLCQYNSLNKQKLTFRIKLLKALSDFYTFVTFAEKQDLGTCTDCGCDLYYKTKEADEFCPQNKWNRKP